MMRFFITTNLVSRILFLHYHLSAINIAVYLLLPTLVCILAKRRRAAFHQTYTWHYNTQGLPMHCIAAKHRELLPHIFTLIRRLADGYFLWHFLIYPAIDPALHR